MIINICASTGEGSTLLSAFDEALHNAGVYNYNILILSSIIPPHTTIKHDKMKVLPSEYGYRLYVVMSQNKSEVSGVHVGSALGWYQEKNGRGVFVEHHATGLTHKEVDEKLTRDVNNSLHDLCTKRRFEFTNADFKIKKSIAQVKKKPLCVMVIAIYKSEPW